MRRIVCKVCVRLASAWALRSAPAALTRLPPRRSRADSRSAIS